MHISQIHFKETATSSQGLKTQTSKGINRLLRFLLIKEKEYLNGNIAYFLTPLGIDALRNIYSMPANIYDAGKNVVKRGYYRASELEMNPRLINHQMHLNQFVIDFMERNPGVPNRYYDEKYASQYTSIRPDGIISFSEVDIFLEMDMATESKKQLCDKWENFRNFINSGEYEYKEKKIIVLFIIGNTNQEESRKDAVKFTIYERMMDLFDGGFEIIVDNHENLLTHLLEEIIPSFKNENKRRNELEEVLKEKHDLLLTDGERLSSVFERVEFSWYGRVLNADNKILVENGRVQEFLIDDYFGQPVSVISKVVYSQKNNFLFRSRYQRDISYLIVVKDIDSIRNDLRMVDALKMDGVFFTTVERLNEYPLHRAIFKVDGNGNVFHFKNSGLEETVFESAETGKRIGI